MSRTIMQTGIAIYRALPIGGAARRKLKSMLLTPVLKNREPFEHPWRGLKLMLDPAQSMDMRLYYDGDYEPLTMAAVEALSRPDSTVIDVGANIGLISLWASKCIGPAGKVVAIDPSAWAISRLERNAGLNGVTNIEPITAAVAGAAGETDMRIINGYRVDDVSTHAEAHVKLVAIDDLVAERGITDLSLIKVDTDGFEVGVFQGARKTLATLRPNLIFEVGPDHLRRAGSSREALVALLKEAGYAFFNEAFEPVDPLTIKIEKNASTNLVGRPV